MRGGGGFEGVLVRSFWEMKRVSVDFKDFGRRTNAIVEFSFHSHCFFRYFVLIERLIQQAWSWWGKLVSDLLRHSYTRLKISGVFAAS